ncbi:MAG: hypothetical protein JOY69_06410 [Candidatus Eremiobacteraeota bacterium]|nr:hypothetical protein [Candidatus Eremiobacteraeota bacterium]MBV8372874.1 hypothetical protein [Candidatus Eremiobacteraeota bacterium]
MNAQRAGGLLPVLVTIAFTFTGCSSTQAPTKWTLWYVPDEPKPGIVVRRARPCNSYVFASSPDQSTYVVAVIDGWTGTNRPQGNSAIMHAGESYAGPLELGNDVVHDDSNGYDLKVNVVYNTPSYLPAKARADADCGPPAGATARADATMVR